MRAHTFTCTNTTCMHTQTHTQTCTHECTHTPIHLPPPPPPGAEPYCGRGSQSVQPALISPLWLVLRRCPPPRGVLSIITRCPSVHPRVSQCQHGWCWLDHSLSQGRSCVWFSSVPGVYPLDGSSTHTHTLPKVSWGTITPAENHWYRQSLVFWSCPSAYGTSVPWRGIKHTTPALEVQSLNYWTAREVPILSL